MTTRKTCSGCGYTCEATHPEKCPICTEALCPDCRPAARPAPAQTGTHATRESDSVLAVLSHHMVDVWSRSVPPATNFTFQKFTCGACGARQTLARPNIVYLSGECEECGYVTDLQHRGGGFTLITTNDPAKVIAMALEMAATPQAFERREGRA